MNNDIVDEEYLEHHGILGMKWGVRNQEARTTTTPRSIKTSTKKSYFQRLGSGAVANMKKDGILAGLADTKIIGSKAGSSRIDFNYNRAKRINALKRKQSDSELLKKGANVKPRDTIEKAIANKVNVPYSKKLTGMSNDDLNAANTRLRLEEEYSRHMAVIAERNKTPTQKLLRAAGGIAVKAASSVATKYAVQALTQGAGSAFLKTAVPKGTEDDVTKAAKDAVAEMNKKNAKADAKKSAVSSGKTFIDNNSSTTLDDVFRQNSSFKNSVSSGEDFMNSNDFSSQPVKAITDPSRLLPPGK